MPKSQKGSVKGSGKEHLTPWQVLNSTGIFSADPWIKLSVDQVLLPDGKIVDDYYQLKLRDFAVTFAETAEGEVVAIRSYKHGAAKVGLVVPAGCIEDGEEPLHCAQRELLEETGYRSDDWMLMGSFVVNGNYGCGQAYLYVARDAEQVAEPDAGDLEIMEVVLMQRCELLDAVRSGDVVGLGSVAAIALALNPAFGVRSTSQQEAAEAS